MKKIVLIFMFTFLFASCSEESNTNSGSSSSTITCNRGTYECKTKNDGTETSRYCEDGLHWSTEICYDGCNESTGRCYGDEGQDDPHGDSTCLVEGAFQCSGNISQKCLDSRWINFQQCNNGCNSATGKCSEDGDTEPDSDTGNTGTTACELDAAYATSDAEAYFAFKGMGEINSRNVQSPSWANMVTATLVGVEGKDLDYADSYSFFMPTTIQGSNAIMLQAMGDPNMSSGRFTAAALAIVPIEYIDFMKENETDHLDQAPIVQIIEFAYSADDAYGKQCILAANKVDETGQIALGKMQICYDKNEEFAVGETFKLSMAAELTVGEALVDFYQDVESVDDLCSCYNMDTEEDVDCADIDWW